MLDIVLDGYKGNITRKSAEILMKRGMQPASLPGKYYFSRDPRLKVINTWSFFFRRIFFNHSLTIAMHNPITCWNYFKQFSLSFLGFIVGIVVNWFDQRIC